MYLTILGFLGALLGWFTYLKYVNGKNKGLEDQKLITGTIIRILSLQSRYKNWPLITIGNYGRYGSFNQHITLASDNFSYQLNTIVTQNYTNIFSLKKGFFTGLTIQFKDKSQDIYIVFTSKKQRDKVHDYFVQKAKILSH